MTQSKEVLSSNYQALVEYEIDKLDKTNYDFNEPKSFLNKEDIAKLTNESSFSELAKKELLIDYGENKFRTAHIDLFFRLIQIRNLEPQRPIPLEFRIVKKKELVPDYGRYKFSEIFNEMIPKSAYSKILIETLLNSIPSKFDGLSSYQYPMINAILSSEYRNVAMVAPTASGKTLAFFLPAFIRLISRTLNDKAGTSSVLIYPRRALGRDQLQNFMKFIDKANEVLVSYGKQMITIGIDDSDTQRRKNIRDGTSFRRLQCVACGHGLILKIRAGQSVVMCPGCGKLYPYMLTNKEDIWEKKPSVLITNIWTIYRRLLSRNTIEQFKAVDYVVIDEAHVYTHFLGGHVSYILKLLRFVARGGKPTFVFSSATIPNPKEFVSNLANVDPDELFYLDFKETLEKTGGVKPQRLLLYLYLLPHPDSNIETLSEALILAVTLWAHKYSMKAITFIDSIAEINTMRDYIHSTILGSREGREVTDHVFSTTVSPDNDYSWSTIAPSKVLLDAEAFREFVMGDFKHSIEMHYAGLTLERRANLENAFGEGAIKLLLSTSTLELGIDLSDVGVIIQHKLPLSPEGVVQRVGRSGRDVNCYRTSTGIVVLPTLPLSTLYMFNDKLRERLESVGFLPPLKVGQTSTSLSLQYFLSLLLLKRAIEGKPTFIDLSLEGLSTERDVIYALGEIIKELDDISKFNSQIGLFDEETLESSIKEMRKLLQPMLESIERIKGMNLSHQSEELMKIDAVIENGLISTREAEDIINELYEKTKNIDIFPENTQGRISQVLANTKFVATKLLELSKIVKLTIKNRDQRIAIDWLGKNNSYLEKITKELPNSDDVSSITLELLTSISKIGFEKFRKKYGVDSNEINYMLGNIGNKFGTGENKGIIAFLKGLPNQVNAFATTDFNQVAAYDAIERFKHGVKLVPWGRLEIFTALSLLLEGRAYFSLMLQPPSPDLELVGVEEV
jgi:superfamily II DNA/RNA helicase